MISRRRAASLRNPPAAKAPDSPKGQPSSSGADVAKTAPSATAKPNAETTRKPVVKSAAAAKRKTAKPTTPKKTRGLTEYATFAAGCFWSTEAVFEHVHGVKSVVSGFSGGSVAYPSYQLVCTGRTGHAESVHIAYDPDIVSYEKLVQLFFEEHDPTTLNSQGDDYGTQYRSVIFYHNEDQRDTAEKVYKDLTKGQGLSRPDRHSTR